MKQPLPIATQSAELTSQAGDINSSTIVAPSLKAEIEDDVKSVSNVSVASKMNGGESQTILDQESDQELETGEMKDEVEDESPEQIVESEELESEPKFNDEETAEMNIDDQDVSEGIVKPDGESMPSPATKPSAEQKAVHSQQVQSLQVLHYRNANTVSLTPACGSKAARRSE